MLRHPQQSHCKTTCTSGFAWFATPAGSCAPSYRCLSLRCERARCEEKRKARGQRGERGGVPQRAQESRTVLIDQLHIVVVHLRAKHPGTRDRMDRLADGGIGKSTLPNPPYLIGVQTLCAGQSRNPEVLADSDIQPGPLAFAALRIFARQAREGDVLRLERIALLCLKAKHSVRQSTSKASKTTSAAPRPSEGEHHGQGMRKERSSPVARCCQGCVQQSDKSSVGEKQNSAFHLWKAFGGNPASAKKTEAGRPSKPSLGAPRQMIWPTEVCMVKSGPNGVSPEVPVCSKTAQLGA